MFEDHALGGDVEAVLPGLGKTNDPGEKRDFVASKQFMNNDVTRKNGSGMGKTAAQLLILKFFTKTYGTR